MRRSVLLALLLGSLLVPSVAAHANFASSHPAPGSRVAASPENVLVTLSEEIDISGSALVLKDHNGSVLASGPLAGEDGRSLRLPLSRNLTNGVYRVEWRALSRIDHHVTESAFAFAVGNTSVTAQAQPAPQGPDGIGVAARLVVYVGLFIVAGVLLFFLLEPASRAVLWRAEWWGWFAMVVGSCLTVFSAAERAEIPGELWLSSVVLRELLLRVGLSLTVLTLLSLVRADRWRLVASLLGAVTMAGLSAWGGHSAAYAWHVTVAAATHLLAAATWVGGLAILSWRMVAGRQQPPESGVVRGLSRAALVCVLIMAATGVLLATTLVPQSSWSADALRTEPYQRLVAAKVALVAIMLALATVNRLMFLPRLDRPAARRGLRRFITGEACLGLAVLVLASILTATTPPRGPSEEDLPAIVGEGEEFRVTMQLSAAARAGTYIDLRFQVVWTQDNSTIMHDNCGRTRGCLQLEIVQPGAPHDDDPDDVHEGGEHRVLEPTHDGWWTVRDVLLVESGEYRLLVEIQTEYVFLDVVELGLRVQESAT